MQYMKGTGKVYIRILCAIFVGVVLGCSGGASGGGIGDGGSTGVNGGGEETGWKQPDYMNITAEFEGQQFIKFNEYGDRWYDDPNKNANFKASYDNAMAFMGNEVKGLSNEQYGDLSTEINKVLNGYNKGTNISETIDKNFTALAPVMSEMENTLLAKSENDFNRYRVSYYKLAHNAYQNSLGTISENTTFKVNQQMLSDIFSNNFFAKKLETAKLSYSEVTIEEAKNIMKTSLNKISANTNASTAVLEKIIELALYNESLYGLNDYAKAEQVNSYSNNLRHEHSINDIGDYIDIYENNKTRNLDDGRTM